MYFRQKPPNLAQMTFCRGKSRICWGGGGGGERKGEGEVVKYIPEDKVQKKENFLNWFIFGKVCPLHRVLPG